MIQRQQDKLRNDDSTVSLSGLCMKTHTHTHTHAHTHTAIHATFKLLPWQPVSIPQGNIVQDCKHTHTHTHTSAIYTHTVIYTHKGTRALISRERKLRSVYERFCAKRYVSHLLRKEKDAEESSFTCTMPCITVQSQNSIVAWSCSAYCHFHHLKWITASLCCFSFWMRCNISLVLCFPIGWGSLLKQLSDRATLKWNPYKWNSICGRGSGRVRSVISEKYCEIILVLFSCRAIRQVWSPTSRGSGRLGGGDTAVK